MSNTVKKESNEWLYKISPCVNIAGDSKKNKEKWFDPKRVIYDNELMLFEKGDYSIEIEDKTYKCTDNFFIIIPPGKWHICRGYTSSSLRKWIHFNWIHQPKNEKPILTYFPNTPLENLYNETPKFIPSDILFGKIKNPSFVFEKHKQLTAKLNNGTPQERLKTRTILLEILLELLTSKEESGLQKDKNFQKGEIIKQKLHDLAWQSFSKAPLIKTHLEESGLSYDYQCRIFKKVYGIPPIQYVNTLRIERAKNMLINTKKKVAKIAIELGFNDIVYFHRLFKKIVLMTPNDFRNRK